MRSLADLTRLRKVSRCLLPAFVLGEMGANRVQWLTVTVYEGLAPSQRDALTNRGLNASADMAQQREIPTRSMFVAIHCVLYISTRPLTLRFTNSHSPLPPSQSRTRWIQGCTSPMRHYPTTHSLLPHFPAKKPAPCGPKPEAYIKRLYVSGTGKTLRLVLQLVLPTRPSTAYTGIRLG